MIVVDTHALYWFLTADKLLSKKTKITIEEATKVIIPTIVLLELLYLLQKNKQKNTFSLVFEKLKNNNKYIFASLDIAVVEEVIKVTSMLEMHDSIILAAANMLNAPIVTKDRSIRKMYTETMW